MPALADFSTISPRIASGAGRVVATAAAWPPGVLPTCIAGVFVILALAPAQALGAPKSFAGIVCNSDIAAALVGRYMPNERVRATEARHADIGLKNLGAYGMENEGDPWTLISWEICNREYLLLERRGIVRDVLASPLPPPSPPSQIASCTVDGSAVAGTAVAFVLANDRKWPRPVEYAWRIDDKTLKFSRIEGKEVSCTP